MQESISRWSWQNLGWRFTSCRWWFWSLSAWWILHLGKDSGPTSGQDVRVFSRSGRSLRRIFLLCRTMLLLTDFRWVRVFCFVGPERVCSGGRSSLTFLDTQFSIDLIDAAWILGEAQDMLHRHVVAILDDRLYGIDIAYWWLYWYFKSFGAILMALDICLARIFCRETLHSSLAAVPTTFWSVRNIFAGKPFARDLVLRSCQDRKKCSITFVTNLGPCWRLVWGSCRDHDGKDKMKTDRIRQGIGFSVKLRLRRLAYQCWLLPSSLHRWCSANLPACSPLLEPRAIEQPCFLFQEIQLTQRACLAVSGKPRMFSPQFHAERVSEAQKANSGCS